MCCSSGGIIIMKHALSLFIYTLCPLFFSFPFSSLLQRFLSTNFPSASFVTCHVHFLICFFLPSPLLPPEVPVSSVLCLSSVRELPVQVRELYAQGFVLVAVHPFVHPCGPRNAHIQRQLHRAVLVRETPRYTN